jgi:hypothetical protein
MTLTSRANQARQHGVAADAPGREPEGRGISDRHPSEGASKIRTQIPVIHRFYLLSALSSLRCSSDITLPVGDTYFSFTNSRNGLILTRTKIAQGWPKLRDGAQHFDRKSLIEP